MIGFTWHADKFFYFFYFLFMCFNYFTMYGMMVVAATPSHHISGIVSSFLLSFWNLFSGFVIPRPVRGYSSLKYIIFLPTQPCNCKFCKYPCKVVSENSIHLYPYNYQRYIYAKAPCICTPGGCTFTNKQGLFLEVQPCEDMGNSAYLQGCRCKKPVYN